MIQIVVRKIKRRKSENQMNNNQQKKKKKRKEENQNKSIYIYIKFYGILSNPSLVPSLKV